MDRRFEHAHRINFGELLREKKVRIFVGEGAVRSRKTRNMAHRMSLGELEKIELRVFRRQRDVESPLLTGPRVEMAHYLVPVVGEEGVEPSQPCD